MVRSAVRWGARVLAVAVVVQSVSLRAPAAETAEKPSASPAVPAPKPGPQPPAPAASPAANPHRAVLDDAWQQMCYANWPKAQELFEKAKSRAADRETEAEALFGLANLWQLREPGSDVSLARTLYGHVVKEFAGTAVAPWALLVLARLADTPEHEKERDVALARQTYEEILAAYPGHYVADEAVLRLGFTYLEKIGDTASEDQGAEMLEKYLAARPQNTLASPQHVILGDFYARRDAYAKAVDHWIAADKAWIPLAERGGLYYRIAAAAEHHLKDYLLAAKWYERITTDAGRDNRYYVAKLAAERCRKLAAEKPAGPAPAAAAGAAGAREGTP